MSQSKKPTKGGFSNTTKRKEKPDPFTEKYQTEHDRARFLAPTRKQRFAKKEKPKLEPRDSHFTGI